MHRAPRRASCTPFGRHRRQPLVVRDHGDAGRIRNRPQVRPRRARARGPSCPTGKAAGPRRSSSPASRDRDDRGPVGIRIACVSTSCGEATVHAGSESAVRCGEPRSTPSARAVDLLHHLLAQHLERGVDLVNVLAATGDELGVLGGPAPKSRPRRRDLARVCARRLRALAHCDRDRGGPVGRADDRPRPSPVEPRASWPSSLGPLPSRRARTPSACAASPPAVGGLSRFSRSSSSCSGPDRRAARSCRAPPWAAPGGARRGAGAAPRTRCIRTPSPVIASMRAGWSRWNLR